MLDNRLRKISYELSTISRNGGLPVEELAEKHNAEDFFLYQELYDKLDDAYRLLRYLSKEIIGEYHLYLNESGRYEAFKGTYYTSGSSIEFLYEGRWHLSTVESNSEQYYIVHFKNLDLEGLKVRIR